MSIVVAMILGALLIAFAMTVPNPTQGHLFLLAGMIAGTLTMRGC